jgi:hypothetical protein
MREGQPLALTGIPQRRPQENDAIPKIAPKWLKYDRQVFLIDYILHTYFKINTGPKLPRLLPRASCRERQ